MAEGGAGGGVGKGLTCGQKTMKAGLALVSSWLPIGWNKVTRKQRRRSRIGDRRHGGITSRSSGLRDGGWVGIVLNDLNKANHFPSIVILPKGCFDIWREFLVAFWMNGQLGVKVSPHGSEQK